MLKLLITNIIELSPQSVGSRLLSDLNTINEAIKGNDFSMLERSTSEELATALSKIIEILPELNRSNKQTVLRSLASLMRLLDENRSSIVAPVAAFSNAHIDQLDKVMESISTIISENSIFRSFPEGTPSIQKTPLKRSVSTPDRISREVNVEISNPISTDDTDILALILAKQHIDDTEKPHAQNTQSFEFFKPIRNQSSYRVDHRLSEEAQKIIPEKRKQMGKLERNDKFGLGIGGGVMISESHMLVAKHCFPTRRVANSDSMHFEFTHIIVRFEYLNTHAYQIEKELSVEDAETLGLKTGENGDLMIVQLRPHEHDGYPGKNNNFTSLKEPSNKKPSTLHFLGYTSGTNLKDSTMPGRPIAMPEVVKRKENATGQHAVWNDFKTHGDIIIQSPFKTSAKLSSAVFNIQSPDRIHEFTVEGDDIYRKNGTLANKVNECYVLYPNIFGTDHVRLAHRTKSGSSGGIYFTENGDIFAVHCGRLPSHKDYPEHIAFYPWAKITTTIYIGRLVYETKPITLAEMIKTHLKNFKAKQYSLSCNDIPMGVITRVNKGSEYQFTIQPTDERTNAFIVSVPFIDDQNNIDINGSFYPRKQITFSLSSTTEDLHNDVEIVPALYRVSLSALTAGDATHEIPFSEQKELAARIKDRKSRQVKHSMTMSGIRFEHTSIGAAQQDAAHYEFVREENDMIAIHAIGSHNAGDTYCISKYSEFFKSCAEKKAQWVVPSDTQPMPVFRLK